MNLFIVLFVVCTVRSDLSAQAYALYPNLAEEQVILKDFDSVNFGSDLDLEQQESNDNQQVPHDSPRIPDESLFSPGFKLYEIGVDEAGHLVFTDNTPSEDVIRSINQDSRSQVAKPEDNGIVANRFKREAESESAHRNIIDVVDDKRPVQMGRTFSLKKPTNIILEVGIVTGFAFYQKFNFQSQDVLKYLAVMINSVNARFSVINDPNITLKLTGVHLIRKLTGQPFINDSKNGTSGYTLEKMLKLFGEWAAENMKNLPKHDVLSLITKVKSDSQVEGIAYLKGACWFPMNQTDATRTVQVVNDDAATYSGAFTLAHELTHSLGAPHDGYDEASNCKFSDGYLMSYEGWGTKNKFNFSSCSTRLMKMFIESSGGECLHTAQVGTYLQPTTKEIGEVLNPTVQCKLQTGVKAAFATDDDSANEFCRRVICKIPITGSLRFRITSKNKPPGYHTPCGKGGICEHGICVNNTETAADRLDMNTMCRHRSLDPAAKRVIADTADAECKVLKCSMKHKDGRVLIGSFGPPLNGSFPCGLGGRCLNKLCIGNKEDPKDKLDLNKVCAKKMEKPEAKLFGGTLPSEYCKLLKCVSEQNGSRSIATFPDFIFPNNSAPCGNQGKCVNKECIGESADRFDMNKECKRLTSKPEAEIFVQPTGTEQCKKLFCKFPFSADTVSMRTYDIPIPDGSFPCGPGKGVCKAQVCV